MLHTSSTPAHKSSACARVENTRKRLGGRYTKNVTICPNYACTTPYRVRIGALWERLIGLSHSRLASCLWLIETLNSEHTLSRTYRCDASSPRILIHLRYKTIRLYRNKLKGTKTPMQLRDDMQLRSAPHLHISSRTRVRRTRQEGTAALELANASVTPALSRFAASAAAVRRWLWMWSRNKVLSAGSVPRSSAATRACLVFLAN